MRIVLRLSALALGPVLRGVCETAGLQLAGSACETAVNVVLDHFRDHSERLPEALREAGDRAWKALELTLAGDSWWDRCRVLLAPGDYQAFRQQVRAFLAVTPLAGLPGHPPEFREQCLRELRAARKAGLLTGGGIEPREVARQAASLARFADPAGLAAAEWQALEQMAEELRQAGYPALAHLLALRPAEGGPLLVVAVRYFFHREIESDARLFQGLAHAQLGRLEEGQERGFAALAEGLARHGRRLEELLGEVHGVVVETHGAVLDVQEELRGQREEIRGLGLAVYRLLEQHQLQRRELQPQDSLSLHGDAERRLVKEVVARYRALPEDQRRRLPALLNAVGKLEVASGDFASARQDFRRLAEITPDAGARAEAHHNGYRTALEAGAWPEALTELLAATRLDPGRFAPFPLDKYEPLHILGAGGFGVAFLCRHRNSGTQVVVKALFAADLERDVSRVFAEARVLEEVQHPAIIRLRDCDYADPAGPSRPFLVMDYFDGLTLADHVARHGPLTPKEWLALAFPVAEALQAAHARGILHRDVKPANLLVHKDGNDWQVKLIDFGLALRRGALAGSGGRPARTDASLAGRSIAGTLDYAAPEQMGRLPGVAVGPYSDVYGFGKTCCFALFRTTQPLPKHWSRLRPGLARLLEHCLAETPEDRPANFTTVLDRLKEERLKLAGMDDSIPVARLAEPARRPVAVAVPVPVPAAAGEAPVAVPVAKLVETPAARPRNGAPAITARTSGARKAVRSHRNQGLSVPVRLGLAAGALAATLLAVVLFVFAIRTLFAHNPAAGGPGAAGGAASQPVVFWKAQPDPPAEKPQGPGNQPIAIRIAPGDEVVFSTPPARYAAVGKHKDTPDTFQVWDLLGPKKTGALHGAVPLGEPLLLSPDGSQVAGTNGGNIEVWSVAQGKKEHQLSGFEPITYVAPGRLLARQNGIAQVWDVAGNQFLQSVTGPNNALPDRKGLAVSPGRKYLAAAAFNKVYLYELATGNPVGEVNLPRPDIFDWVPDAVAFSDDGTELAGMFNKFVHDGRIFVWDMATGERILDHPYLPHLAEQLGQDASNYSDSRLEWLPDKSGWLVYGQGLVERTSGKRLWTLNRQTDDAKMGPRRLLDRDHLLVVAGTGDARVLKSLDLPWKQIAPAFDAARSGR
jgi:tetratricopeptide (TPR) repeat protein